MLHGKFGLSVITKQFNFKNQRIFVTGHTGFKGSWLCHILYELGADVYGFSLPAKARSHYNSANTIDLLTHIEGDINNYTDIKREINFVKPDLVIHMAAQPLVRYSYSQPLETFQTNGIGTANLLNSCYECETIPHILIVTSDKCYENKERGNAFKESDPMGGKDPYSASKGVAELITASFAESFFIPAGKSISSVRGGNVLGGGDWSEDRIMTDIVESLSKEKAPTIRNPNAIRPWQHVLDVLFGYLAVINYSRDSIKPEFHSFNIGPYPENILNVLELTKKSCQIWGTNKDPIIKSNTSDYGEANFLKLDIQKALNLLEWEPRYSIEQTIEKTISWYKAENEGQEMSGFTKKQIQAYFRENYDK